MRIVVLSENFLQESHKSRLERLGEVKYFLDTNTKEKAIERLTNVDAAIFDMFVTPPEKEVLESAKSLKYITLNSTGYDLIDVGLCKKLGILVSNNPGFSTDAVAEHVFALMLAVLRRIPILDRQIREKPFEIADPVDFPQLVSTNLKGKTLGIIGLGTIGSRVGEIGKGLGMKVIAYNRSAKKIKDISPVSLKELLQKSDVVTIHLPLNKDTEYIIGEKELSLMKKGAVIINTARGKHVDNEALSKAIEQNKIFGAGMDVLDGFTKDNPLLEIKDRVVVSPHSAWFTKESLENWAEGVTKNMEAFVSGKPVNVINQ